MHGALDMYIYKCMYVYVAITRGQEIVRKWDMTREELVGDGREENNVKKILMKYCMKFSKKLS